MKNQSIFRRAPFILCLICFFLPFVEVSCQGNKIVSLKGYELAKGTDIDQDGQKKHIDAETSFTLAAICVGAAVGLSSLAGKSGKLITAIVGLGGCGALIAGKIRLDNEVAEQGGGAAMNAWQIGFYAALVLLIAGAAVAGFQFMQDKTKETETG